MLNYPPLLLALLFGAIILSWWQHQPRPRRWRTYQLRAATSRRRSRRAFVTREAVRRTYRISSAASSTASRRGARARLALAGTKVSSSSRTLPGRRWRGFLGYGTGPHPMLKATTRQYLSEWRPHRASGHAGD